MRTPPPATAEGVDAFLHRVNENSHRDTLVPELSVLLPAKHHSITCAPPENLQCARPFVHEGREFAAVNPIFRVLGP